MSAAGLLIVGSLDLSPYLDVQQGHGMDPAAATFSDRVFTHSLLKEGGVLALENLKLKEMVFPLLLHATSRSGLSALVQQVNRQLAMSGQTVQWQDQGAAQPTSFDLASGQLDLEYDFRRAGGYWLAGKLRLFTQPLGRTATARLVASAAGTGPLLMLPVASPILGDANALMAAQVQIGSQVATSGRLLGLSVLPGPSGAYQPLWPAASLQAGGASGVLMGASGALASQLVRAGPGGVLGGLSLTGVPVQPYGGENRVLAIARAPAGGTVSLTVGNQFGVYGPTGVCAASDWTLADLGVQRIPSALGATQNMVWSVWTGGATCDVTGLIVIPDSQTVFVSDSIPGPAAFLPRDSYLFDAAGRTCVRQNASAYGNVALNECSGVQRGSIPPVSPNTSTLVVFEMPAAGGAANDLLNASVSVTERVRFEF